MREWGVKKEGCGENVDWREANGDGGGNWAPKRSFSGSEFGILGRLGLNCDNYGNYNA